ncbi:MAG: putative peptidoglycan lipid flippase, partial [Abditibacteriota bacterium]|nr:putative peptidoglycan lipid flippase [Abditibacteriota bacterium]
MQPDTSSSNRPTSLERAHTSAAPDSPGVSETKSTVTSKPAQAAPEQAGRTRKAALLVTGSTGISALIGIANGLISARFFGVSRAMDAYLIAVIVPQLLGFLFGIRLSVFLVPWLISMRHAHGARFARTMEWRLGLLFPLCTALLLGLSLRFGEAVVRLLAPEFEPDKAAIAVSLLHWTVPGGVAVVAMAILTSIAHSHQRFRGASLAGVINPLVTFLLLVTVGKTLGVQTIAMGFFLGPLLGCLPILWSLRGSLQEPEEQARQWAQVPVFQMVFLLGLMTTAHNQIPLIVARRIASSSSMGDGVISGLQYAMQFSWMPVTILATSVGTALLPSMVEKHQKTKEGLDETALLDAARAMRVLAYLLVPLAFLIWFFAFPVVSLALSGGEFDKNAVIVTSEAMRYYVPLIWIG